jgi:hypothetical protein
MRSLLASVSLLMILGVPATGQELDARAAANGAVPDEVTALRIAEAVLVGAYGEHAVAQQQPLTANLFQEIWWINGTLSAHSFGRKMHIEISKRDGRILVLAFGRRANSSSM